ncbi:glucose-1-phosphate adenylyltransferase family protein [Striga asiatica]|uniref:Glucose-1-phosphate adenylyltransferase family protein n=1 Tax=Striga asiatica TaxID=4170 RepID=A0A5A7QIU0_STRAF|nr:glucose-1-phosphate adenylyltransferase family protein [Striga asiatica]
MSESNGESEIGNKGKEWEVVTLTESIYAAAPASKQDNILHQVQTDLISVLSPETAHAMIMSGHFGYSSTMHENSLPKPNLDEGNKPESKHEENFNLKDPISDEYGEFRKYDDEKGDSMSFYSAGKFDPYDDDEANVDAHEPVESVDPAVNPDMLNFEEDKSSELPNIPCEAWWRNCADTLCGRAKSVNPYWSIAIAAAVVGIVIISNRWQRDNRPHVFQLKSLLAVDNEGTSGWILGPMATHKGASLSARHISYM